MRTIVKSVKTGKVLMVTPSRKEAEVWLKGNGYTRERGDDTRSVIWAKG